MNRKIQEGAIERLNGCQRFTGGNFKQRTVSKCNS